MKTFYNFLQLKIEFAYIYIYSFFDFCFSSTIPTYPEKIFCPYRSFEFLRHVVSLQFPLWCETLVVIERSIGETCFPTYVLASKDLPPKPCSRSPLTGSGLSVQISGKGWGNPEQEIPQWSTSIVFPSTRITLLLNLAAKFYTTSKSSF